jgi:hypothetical protein
MEIKNITGIDFSLNHFGAVTIDFESGKPIKSWYTYQTKKYVKTYTEKNVYGLFLPGKFKDESKISYNCRRWEAAIESVINFITPNYVCLEDYAYSDQTNRIVQIAELTGILKWKLMKEKFLIRTHEPGTVKMFGAKHGKALKIQMVNSAEQSGYSLPKDLFKETTKKVRGVKVPELDGPGTDLCDAYHMAQMLRLELLVREGKLDLKNVNPYILEKLFLRVTKFNPENVLAREFIKSC